MTSRSWLVSEDTTRPDDEEPESTMMVGEFTSLREARDEVGGRYVHASETDQWPIRSPRWLTFPKWNDGTREYYEEGITRDRVLHFPEHVTTASRLRVCRLFGLKVGA